MTMQARFLTSLAAIFSTATLLPFAPAVAGAEDSVAFAANVDEVSSVNEALDAARIGDIAPIERLLQTKAVPAPDKHVLLAQVHAARAEDAEAAAALNRYFASGDTDPRNQASAHEIAAGTAFARGRYADAVRHAAAYMPVARQVQPQRLDEMQQLLEIAQLLAVEPGQRLLHRGSGEAVAAPRDKVGLIRTRVRFGNLEEEAVLDTGAALSVVNETTARRMGLRLLDGTSSVGNSIGTDVAVRLAIAERLEIAGATLSNVVFLVMADDQLDFPVVPGGYRIDAIVGLPVLRALGRVEFEAGKTFRVLPASAQTSARGNLRLIGSSPFVVARVSGVEAPLYLDSGASNSALLPQFTRAHGKLALGDEETTSGKAGAGGSTSIRSKSLASVPFVLGNRFVVVPQIAVELEQPDDEEPYFGVIGNDLMDLFDTVVLDFDAMQVIGTGAGAPAGADRL